jgi:hypothetical protein
MSTQKSLTLVTNIRPDTAGSRSFLILETVIDGDICGGKIEVDIQSRNRDGEYTDFRATHTGDDASVFPQDRGIDGSYKLVSIKPTEDDEASFDAWGRNETWRGPVIYTFDSV